MGVIPDGMHEAPLAGVDFQTRFGRGGRQQRFDDVAFLAADPEGLRQCALRDRLPGLEEIAIRVAGVGLCGDFCEKLDVARYDQRDMREFEVLEPQEGGIVFVHPDLVFEVRRTGAGEGQ